MKRFLASVSIPVLALFCACSDDASTSGDQGTGAGGSTALGGSAGAETAGSGGQAGQPSAGGSGETGGSSQAEGGAAGSAGSPAPSVPLCQKTCSAPADCAKAGLYPESEWQCDQGVCRHLGCSSDSSCEQAFKTSDYVCRPYAGATGNMCQKKCTSVLDCVVDTGAWSADNWTCQGDYCVYLGCNSDAECLTTGAGLDFRCRQMPGVGFKYCVKGCNIPADCAYPNAPEAIDASRYACKQGVCEYLGCPSDASCQQYMNDQSYVCK